MAMCLILNEGLAARRIHCIPLDNLAAGEAPNHHNCSHTYLIRVDTFRKGWCSRSALKSELLCSDCQLLLYLVFLNICGWHAINLLAERGTFEKQKANSHRRSRVGDESETANLDWLVRRSNNPT